MMGAASTKVKRVKKKVVALANMMKEIGSVEAIR